MPTRASRGNKKPCPDCGASLTHRQAMFHKCTAKKPESASSALQPVDTCIEHGPGGTLRLSFQIRVF